MITIIKQDHLGYEVWRYPARLVDRNDIRVLVSARFNRTDMPFHGLLLKTNDLFFEAYYYEKWYNIYEIYDRDDGLLKGWYCNITRPAIIKKQQIIYHDLALDLLVHPSGQQILLDEDEFSALTLTEKEQENAWQAVGELQALLADRTFRLRDIEK